MNDSTNVKIYYLGEINKISLQNSDKDRDIQLIDRVEEAQLTGQLCISPTSKNLVDFNVCLQGIKVQANDVVLSRFPLHQLVRVVYYSDTFEKHNLILSFLREDDNLFDCQVFQSEDEEPAVLLCETFKKLFDVILTP